MNSLLAYDYETTGLDPVRDRPVQFACLRLDMDLNVIGRPATLYCQPAPDHLPDPQACLVTGITPQRCQALGLPELQFVHAVHRELAAPGTIAFGYNSIAFDEEVTRFMFWRNLIDPYAREWKDGCGRWDLLGLVRATYTLRPETLEWPGDERGKVSFALERISAANGLPHDTAHDAMSDVLATVALARRIRERQPQLFAHCFSMLDKNLALQEMDVASHSPFIHVGRGSAKAAGIRIMMPLAPHPTNRNEVIAWDLAKDPRQLLDIDAETMRRRLFTRPEERPDDFEPMPIRCIAANKSPVVFKNPGVLSRERAAELEIDLGAALANVPVMRGVMETVDLARLLQVVFAREPAESDVEEALYAGFVGNADRRLLDQLRSMDPATFAGLKPGFLDPRLDELFLRYKARHYPGTLTQREEDKWEEHRFRKLIEGAGGSRTVAMVREAVSRCRQTLAAPGTPADPARQQVLDDVLAYTNGVAAVIDPFGTVPPPEPEPVQTPVPAPAPVQPDLFGGADVTPGKRRAKARRS
ncbi:Exodeoxyribonuclease I [Massilia sp. Bi118]|uniref:exodeoxyribonuclease I n=1 Tax=Massilia sp. Bi118 TaxID=2822346 RepID=UPI001D2E4FFC|nr:exodeoxyribonuclease I [Massilia sp. Bi118]CAH0190040.1 Exodeoxyribonuclease I [Massilia sp. Bi118]